MYHWQAFPANLTITPREVHLIGYSVEAQQVDPLVLACLSELEKERAYQFKFKKHQQRYILFHAFLRNVLAAYTGIPAHLLEFAYTLKNKPYLKNMPELQFNLSHSKTEGMIAISLQAQVGVDIEKQETKDISELAARFLSSSEVAYLNALPAALRTESFYEIWVHKEAFIKAIGLGLSHNLKKFVIGIRPSRLIQADDYHIADWTIQAFNWKPGYVGAFATEQVIDNICYFKYENK